MAWEKLSSKTVLEPDSYQCLSTDTKETLGIKKGSTCWELDTKAAWVYSESNTNPATSDGWWGV